MNNPDSTRVVVHDGKLFDVVTERWRGVEREIARHPGSILFLRSR